MAKLPVPYPQLPPFVAVDMVEVTPSDSTELSFAALYIGGTGDVVITPLAGGSPVTFAAYPGGAWLPVAGSMVNAATSATGIVAVN